MNFLRFSFVCLVCFVGSLRSAELLTDVQLAGSANQVKSGATLTVVSGGTVTVASGGSFILASGSTFTVPAAGITWASVSKSGSSLADLATRSASDLSSGTLPDARFPATLPAASGVNLTALNASNLASGTVPDARFPATLPALNGSALTALNASNLGSGTVPDARFPATLPALNGSALTALNASNVSSGTLADARLSAILQAIAGLTLSEGDILYRNGSTVTRLARGSDGQVLKSTASTIAWGTDSTGAGGLPAMPTAGDIVYFDGMDWVSVGIGTANQKLRTNAGATAPEWFTDAGGASAATTTSTGNQDDFSFSNATVLYANNATLLTIRGLAAGIDGQTLTIVSKGAGQVDIAHQNTNSTAANRIINQVTGTISLAPGTGSVTLVYDDTTDRWRVVGHRQGAYIHVAHSGGNFTGDGSLTWTVSSGDQLTFKYLLDGKNLTVDLLLNATTVSGTGGLLQIAVPGGFTIASGNRYEICMVYDNVTQLPALFQLTGSATIIKVCKDLAETAWSAASDTSRVLGAVSFEVQ